MQCHLVKKIYLFSVKHAVNVYQTIKSVIEKLMALLKNSFKVESKMILIKLWKVKIQ